MTTETENLKPLSTPSFVSVDSDVPTAGAIVYWHLSGEVRHAALAKAFEEAGIPAELLPPEPSSSSVLRRAVMELREATLLVRPFKPEGGSPGFALVREERVADDLVHCTEWTVTPDAQGELVIHAGPRAKGSAPAVPEKLRALYSAMKGELTSGEVGSWLVDQVRACRAVSLRETGGVYFMPRGALDLWRMLVNVLRTSTAHNVFEIPALKTDEAVGAILDAVNREAAALADEIAEAASGELGKRAAGTRIAQVDQMKEKLAAYETLLGTSLASMTEKLDTIRGSLVAIRVQEATNA